MQDKIINPEPTEKLIGKKQLLEQEFDEPSRPSMRWLDYQIAAKALPVIRIGGKVFFIPSQVRAAIRK